MRAAVTALLGVAVLALTPARAAAGSPSGQLRIVVVVVRPVIVPVRAPEPTGAAATAAGRDVVVPLAPARGEAHRVVFVDGRPPAFAYRAPARAGER